MVHDTFFSNFFTHFSRNVTIGYWESGIIYAIIVSDSSVNYNILFVDYNDKCWPYNIIVQNFLVRNS